MLIKQCPTLGLLKVLVTPYAGIDSKGISRDTARCRSPEYIKRYQVRWGYLSICQLHNILYSTNMHSPFITSGYQRNLHKFETILQIIDHFTPGSFYCHEHELVCNNGEHPEGSFACQGVLSAPKLMTYRSESVVPQVQRSEAMARTISLPGTRSKRDLIAETPLPCGRSQRRVMSSFDPPVQVFSPYYRLHFNATYSEDESQSDHHTFSSTSSYDDYNEYDTDTDSIISRVSPKSTLNTPKNYVLAASLPVSEDVQPAFGRRSSLRGKVSSLIQQFQLRRNSKKQNKAVQRASKKFRRLSFPEKRRLYTEAEASVFLESRIFLHEQYVA